MLRCMSHHRRNPLSSFEFQHVISWHVHGRAWTSSSTLSSSSNRSEPSTPLHASALLESSHDHKFASTYPLTKSNDVHFLFCLYKHFHQLSLDRPSPASRSACSPTEAPQSVQARPQAIQPLGTNMLPKHYGTAGHHSVKCQNILVVLRA